MKSIFTFAIVLACACLYHGTVQGTFYYKATNYCPGGFSTTQCRDYINNKINDNCTLLRDVGRDGYEKMFERESCNIKCPPNSEERRNYSKPYPGCCPTCELQRNETLYVTLFNFCPDGMDDKMCHEYAKNRVADKCMGIYIRDVFNGKRMFARQTCHTTCSSNYVERRNYNEAYPDCCPICVRKVTYPVRQYIGAASRQKHSVDFYFCKDVTNKRQCYELEKSRLINNCTGIIVGNRFNGRIRFALLLCNDKCLPNYEARWDYSKQYPECCPACVLRDN